MKLALCIIVQTIIVVNLMVDTVCCIYRSFIIYIIFHLNIFVFRWFKKNKMKKNCKKNTNFFFFFMFILFIMIYLHVQIDPELLVYWFAEVFKQVTVKSKYEFCRNFICNVLYQRTSLVFDMTAIQLLEVNKWDACFAPYSRVVGLIVYSLWLWVCETF